MHWKIRWAAAWCILICIAILVICALVGLLTIIDVVGKEEPVDFKTDFKVDIRRAEGKVMHVYRDSLKIPTAGIGHKVTDEDRNQIEWEHMLTEEQVQLWFESDYKKMMIGVTKYFSEFDTWPRRVQLAVGNWLWQLGADAPKNFPRATKALQEKRWADAANEWLYSDPRTMHWSIWRKETPHRCEQEAERLQEEAK